MQGVLTWIAFLDLNCKVLAIGSCGLENWIKTMSLCWGQNPECVWSERGMALQQRALLGFVETLTICHSLDLVGVRVQTAQVSYISASLARESARMTIECN